MPNWRRLTTPVAGNSTCTHRTTNMEDEGEKDGSEVKRRDVVLLLLLDLG
jgi:hypothetical protein